MEIKRGIPVSPGISIAEVLVLDSEEIRIPQRFIPKTEVEAEVERFEEAVTDSNRLLEKEIDAIWKSSLPSREIVELRNMILVGILVAEDAIMRQENRGLHFNKDLIEDLE